MTYGSFFHDGHRLVYYMYGDRGPVLVYLHGLLIDSEINGGIAAAVAERGHRVVLLDLLGHGRSDKPAHASESTPCSRWATPTRARCCGP
jgi:pimeloyl-ACP methyl ester carboxylesterase